ncbi:MAG: hypothetical protein DF168_01256 [Candidatus Moanabacter tarae]|uniref:Xylose isomerase-like TIM barrel domain-containing protein n=1 Tax=Candidatus Moanibacter tarae TaxID=2200854 RepID=A0A2Z4AIU9_9BACT|nr:MAG: hypothetical protein DF168_01256 [Candidatus Moanabacter tarae]|tara:strand:+ start:12048 stop:12854 length:807 start_codon:yes stop_codon:yes gene_type:complete
MKWTIGSTTRPYSSIPFVDACRRIADAGYSDVAVFGNEITSKSSNKRVLEVREAATNVGLTPSMVLGRTELTQGLDKGIDDFKRLIDNVAEVGAKWLLDCGTSNPDDFANFYELMRRVSPHAEASGVSISLKPHGGITLTIEDLIRAYNKVNHPGFGLCYDPGNIIYYTKGKLRPEPFAERIAPMTTTFIIKDCILNNETPDVMITPGNGLVDFEKVIGGLVNNGFNGPLFLECVGGTHLEDIDREIAESLDFVRCILKKISELPRCE